MNILTCARLFLPLRRFDSRLKKINRGEDKKNKMTGPRTATMTPKCLKHSRVPVTSTCNNCSHVTCKFCEQQCVNCAKEICRFCSYSQFSKRIHDGKFQSGIYLCHTCRDTTHGIAAFCIKEEYANEFQMTGSFKTAENAELADYY
jgi:hypothetical protein